MAERAESESVDMASEIDARGTGCHERAAAAINEWEVAEGGRGRVLLFPGCADQESTEEPELERLRGALHDIAGMDDHDTLSKARRCAQEALGEGP